MHKKHAKLPQNTRNMQDFRLKLRKKRLDGNRT